MGDFQLPRKSGPPSPAEAQAETTMCGQAQTSETPPPQRGDKPAREDKEEGKIV